jgi:phenylpropionate dioxygenase-like ring-hydroxylating dioxygenase large terminal subunit
VLVSDLPVLRRHWHPVSLARAIGDGPVPVRVLGTDVVLWRADGELRAALDRCPHRLARLSGGALECGRLVCPYHAWSFGADGHAVDIPQLDPHLPMPSAAHLAMVYVQERYGAVWVALDEPVADVPAFPEAEREGYRVIPSFDEEWNASAMWVTDNAVDIAHVNVVHAATIGNPEARRLDPYVVEFTGAGFLARMSLSVAGVAAQSAVDGGTVQRVMEVELVGPLACRVAIRYPSGREHVLFIVACPVDDGRCRYVQILARNDTEADVPAAELLAVDRAVVSEDRRICELLPVDFPVDAGATVSLRCDRITVEYRRYLADLRDGARA